ncbi:MAG: DNA mismatch repair protein MutS [Lachnospiraceae bacterium]|nr:DNA mismatch repair protein MutS [Lachnospiraceae bacterium]
MEVDLHGMDVKFAKGYLKDIIEFTCEKEIIVIHGYHAGNKIMEMVQRDFKHKKLKRKIKSLNSGITIFELE